MVRCDLFNADVHAARYEGARITDVALGAALGLVPGQLDAVALDGVTGAPWQ